MLCKYNGQGPLSIGHGIPYEPKNKAGGKVVTRLQVLIPGVNMLPDEFWATECLKNKTIKGMLKPDPDGKVLLQVLAETTESAEAIKKAAEKHVAQELAHLDETEGAEVVGMTLNKGLLDKWNATESRPMVRMAITNQLEKLKLKLKTKKT